LPGALLVVAVSATCTSASVAGTSTAAQSITAERIAVLPRKQQAAWRDYLARSIRQMQADRAFLQAELKAAGLAEPLTPPNGLTGRSMPLTKPPEWYGSAEARRVAGMVVSFQTPAGGWSKNLNVADHVRQKGESFAPNNLSRYLAPDDFDAPHDPHWNYMGTLDNDATTTELQFLARVVTAVDAKDNAPYRASFLRGLEYLLAAQFPNGGWPQVWPLEGGYHDAITFNDGAVAHAIELLQSVAEGTGAFAFVPVQVRKRARASVARGLECVRSAQIVENGHRTVWGQQHDALTLRPVAGRNYEPAAQCSSESASMMLFLMSLPKPSPAMAGAIHAAAAWLQKVAIHDQAYGRGPDGGRLTAASGAKPIWARFYEIGTDRPIFGDRDKSIHDNVEELSRERRMGYNWYNSGPQEALDRYAQWSLSYPRTKGSRGKLRSAAATSPPPARGRNPGGPADGPAFVLLWLPARGRTPRPANRRGAASGRLSWCGRRARWPRYPRLRICHSLT
jgi:PelA/Pel-15E family pectate lyase